MAVAAIALTGLLRRHSFSEGALSPSQLNQHQYYSQPGDLLPFQRRGTKIASGDAPPNPSPWQKRRGRRSKRGSKKWNEKKVDTEFDLVIVPADGISMSDSDSGDSDWSVGWFEPHNTDFTDNELEDSFAVLVPCYGSSTPQLAAGPARSPFQLEEPHSLAWANVLANLSPQTHEEHKKHLQRWLSGL